MDNILTVHNSSVTPEDSGSFVFVHGQLEVLPDIQIFIRGDTNGDGGVDISDPQHTLNFLFTGGPKPVCHDAADANDDGFVDISDAVKTLEFLFLTGEPLPSPNDVPDVDPTPDRLGCLVVFSEE